MGSLRDAIEQAAPVLPSHEVDRVIAVVNEILERPRPMDVSGLITGPKDKDILQRAHELVHGQRQKDYGSPEENFNQIATAWSSFLGIEIDAGQVCMCMILLKVMRQTKGYHEDSTIDIAGYAALTEMVTP